MSNGDVTRVSTIHAHEPRSVHEKLRPGERVPCPKPQTTGGTELAKVNRQSLLGLPHTQTGGSQPGAGEGGDYTRNVEGPGDPS